MPAGEAQQGLERVVIGCCLGLNLIDHAVVGILAGVGAQTGSDVDLVDVDQVAQVAPLAANVTELGDGASAEAALEVEVEVLDVSGPQMLADGEQVD